MTLICSKMSLIGGYVTFSKLSCDYIRYVVM